MYIITYYPINLNSKNLCKFLDYTARGRIKSTGIFLLLVGSMQSLQVSSKANGRRNLCDGNVICATLPMCLCTGQCCFCISRKNKFPSNGKILSGEPNGLSELKSRTMYRRTPPPFAITVNKEFWNLVPDNKGSFELTPNSDMQKKSYTFSSFQTQKNYSRRR